MNFNYDLIILGLTKTGCVVAEYALKLGARVAIIDNLNRCDRSLSENIVYYFNGDSLSDLDGIIQQEKKKFEHHLKDLQLLGLDIYNQEFYLNNQRKIVNISTDNYQLFSPVSIIALSNHQLFKSQALSPQTLSIYDNAFPWQKIAKETNQPILIKGNNLEAICLSQTLSSFGKNISLLSNKSPLLPYEDEDISWHLQLSLEAKGVKIFNDDSLALNKNQEINGDYQLIIDTEKEGFEIPTYLDKNVGIKWKNNQIQVNQKLQTHNHKIYACGEILGGYHLETLNEYEARIAVENSLFFPLKTIDYNQVGYTLNINPPLYRIGYTERQIRELNNNSFSVIKFSLNFNYHRESNFLKLIVSRDDYILGFHGLGDNLIEVFNLISYIRQNNLKISYLFKHNFSEQESYQIIKELKDKWLAKNKRQNQIIMDIQQTFLLWKRP